MTVCCRFSRNSLLAASFPDANGFGANIVSDQSHQLSELLVGGFGLGVHEIEDFAGLIGHALNMRLNEPFDKSRMAELKTLRPGGQNVPK